MTFRIELSREANRDLCGYYQFASQHSVPDALRWMEKFEAAISVNAPSVAACLARVVG